jgi:hypothetical protein
MTDQELGSTCRRLMTRISEHKLPGFEKVASMSALFVLTGVLQRTGLASARQDGARICVAKITRNSNMQCKKYAENCAQREKTKIFLTLCNGHGIFVNIWKCMTSA